MPMLFVAVGQKLGLDVTLSQAPEHYFVKYRDNAGSEFNLETTSGAGLTSDSWIIQNTHATPESIKSGIYLRRLSRRETLIAMLNELMRSMVVDNNEAAAIDLANLCLQYWSNDFSAMLILHFAYGHAAKREFQDRYAWPEDIPRDLYPRYKELARDSQFWRMRAEALGWQEPTDKKEEEYLRSINEATTDSKLRGQP